MIFSQLFRLTWIALDFPENWEVDFLLGSNRLNTIYSRQMDLTFNMYFGMFFQYPLFVAPSKPKLGMCPSDGRTKPFNSIERLVLGWKITCRFKKHFSNMQALSRKERLLKHANESMLNGGARK